MSAERMSAQLAFLHSREGNSCLFPGLFAHTIGMANIFSGAEAFTAVAHPGGLWNWALVGPDPVKLPLAGGGAGGCTDLQACLSTGEHANYFGLIRVEFAPELEGAPRICKYIFLHLTNADLEVSAVQRGRAMEKRKEMESAVGKFVKFNASVQLANITDLEEFLLDKLKVASTVGAEAITKENADKGYQAFLDENPDIKLQRQEAESRKKEAEAFCADIRGFAFESEKPQDETNAPEEAAGSVVLEQKDAAVPKPLDETQKNEIETTDEVLFKKGDRVKVWSNMHKKWYDDGICHEFADIPSVRCGIKFPKCSVQVMYDYNKKMKWLTPSQAKRILAPSTRPPYPPTMVGELYKETHNMATEWVVRYCLLSRGHLQWWVSHAEAKSGSKPDGSLFIWGLRLQVAEDRYLNITTASSRGTVYSFDTTTKAGAEKWANSLKAHSTYSEEMREYAKSKKGEVDGPAD